MNVYLEKSGEKTRLLECAFFGDPVVGDEVIEGGKTYVVVKRSWHAGVLRITVAPAGKQQTTTHGIRKALFI